MDSFETDIVKFDDEFDIKKYNLSPELLNNPKYLKQIQDSVLKMFSSLEVIENKKFHELNRLNVMIDDDFYRLRHHLFHISNTVELDEFSLRIDPYKKVFTAMIDFSYEKFNEFADEQRSELHAKYEREKTVAKLEFENTIMAIELEYHLTIDVEPEFGTKDKFDESWLAPEYRSEDVSETKPKKVKYTKYTSKGCKIAVRKRELKVVKTHN